MTGRLKIAFPYLLFAVMAALVVWSNLPGGRMAAAPAGEQTESVDGEAPSSAALIDPVCQMQVNTNWGFHHDVDGATFHFCSRHCVKQFAADPDAYIAERCVVCSTPIDRATALPATYMDQTYYLHDEDCRTAFKADPASHFMHTMWGIPDWLYYVSIAVVLVVSFGMFEAGGLFRRLRSGKGCNRGKSPQAAAGLVHDAAATHSRGALALPIIAAPAPGSAPRSAAGTAAAVNRIDVMQWSAVRRLLLSRPVRAFVQLSMVGLFLLIIAAGLFGNQNPALNIAPLLTWTIWWCGLVVLIMFAGKAWCYMCPWDAMAGWAERLRFWKKNEQGGGLALPWPRLLRNIWLATGLFIALTWIEIGFGVTMRPAATAWLAVAMLLLTIVSAFLFDRKSFCRYGCLVGRVSGLYAMFAGVEVRAKDGDVCQTCRTKECVRGSDAAYGCPTFEYPGKMELNTYCIQCTECLQACPHDNMAVNLRPWAADLAAKGKPRKDEAYLALLMLAISSFHGLTMTPVWDKLTGGIESLFSAGRIASFTVGMGALLAAPILIYAALVWLSYRIAARRGLTGGDMLSYRDYFIRYAYCVLPIALFYHLAHNLEHLLMEGPKALALISDPFGRGWNLLGTAAWRIPPLVSLDVLWILQVMLVAVGHVYSLWAAGKISQRVFSDRAAATQSQWPMLLGMILFSIFSLWLLKQPMVMRTSAM